MDLCIIIPVYNAKDTLSKTLDSIKEQVCNLNYEVILVNDCSSYDYSKDVINYSRYFNIREINTKRNIGPGGARQLGIDNSSSKYIIFIDSDDTFYDSNSINKMYEEISSSECDLLISSFIYCRDNRELVKNNDLIWLHGKMYKRSFLEKHKIRFNDTRANEDNGFNRLILLMCPMTKFISDVIYVYNENVNSITRKDNRLYKFSGLEGYAYNMNWAMDEALSRGRNKKDIAILALDTLSYLYLYYLYLKNEYDVSKILLWSKNIKDKYLSCIDLLDDGLCDEILEDKKKELDDEIDISSYDMSFNDFIGKIE